MHKKIMAFSLCCLLALSGGCKQAPEKASTMPEVSPLEEYGKILSGCTKVEYVLNDYGITFETESTAQIMRLYSYIQNEPAVETGCTANYDGGAVFKDVEGDIKTALEFNFKPDCNRAVFVVNGKTHKYKLSPEGIAMFKQVIDMRSTVSPDSGE